MKMVERDVLPVWAREADDLKAAFDEHAIVAITDAEGRITFVNERFCAVSQFLAEELVGQDYRTICVERYPNEFYHELRRGAAHDSRWRGEMQFQAKDGTRFWIAATIVPVLDERGNQRQFVVIGEDLTERKRIEGELAEMQRLQRQLREELAHAMRVASLGELVAMIAHELNQPLAAILSNAQAAQHFLADGGIDPNELHEILADIVRDDKRAGNVIHSLRAMVRKRPATRESYSLNELVTEVLELLHGEMIGEKVELRLALAQELPPVEAVRVELQQVLVNLLVNAVHAMEGNAPASRVIELETQAEEGAVVVRVRDSGCGIPADRLDRIFDPFFSTRASGLGMGLSICRRIVEGHGGRIEARNHRDGGAVFIFSLPIAAARWK